MPPEEFVICTPAIRLLNAFTKLDSCACTTPSPPNFCTEYPNDLASRVIPRAVTTTSPSTLVSSSIIRLTISFSGLNTTFLNPTQAASSSPILFIIFNTKLPLTSVMVPLVVPFSMIVAPITGSPFGVLIVPFTFSTGTGGFAIAAATLHNSINKQTFTLNIVFI